MTHSETEKTKELAEIIVEKIRNLFALQSRILENRGQPTQTAAHHDAIEPAEPQDARTPEDQETLTTLETQLKERIKETEEFIDQLKSETPSLKTYILPQMHQIIETLKTDTPPEQTQLAKLVNTLTEEGNTQSLEQLEAIIITHLRDNLKKTFGI